MPTLKHLVCNVLWGETGAPFPEYGTQYGDGFVETFIAIPNHPQPFSIRLNSRKFIHEGLAMLVFIDGNYQCNRVRVNLQSPEKELPESRSKIDFVVRQRETRLGDGSYMGREWRFDDFNVVQQLPPGASETHFEELGTIEVFVLRCSSNDPAEFDSLSDSSKEDSVILEHEDDNAKRSTEESTEVAPEPDLETLPFWGIFDGSSDRPLSSQCLQVDGPADNYHHWDFGYRPGPYPPQQGPRYPPRPYQQERVHDGTFHHRRPTQPPPQPPPRGERQPPDHLPPRPERRVHFDYGSPREGSVYNGRHQSQPMPRYYDDYCPHQHYEGHQPYGDYPSRHTDHQYVHRAAEPRDYRDYPEPPMAHGALGVPLASSSRIPGLSERATTLPTHPRMGSVPAQVPPHQPAPAPLPYTGIQPFPGQHQIPIPTWVGPHHQAFPPAVPGPAQFFPYLPPNTAPWFQVPNQPIPQTATTSTGTGANNDAAKENAGSAATATNAKAESSDPTTKDSNTNVTCPNWNTQNKTDTDKTTNKLEQDQTKPTDQGTTNANDNQDRNNNDTNSAQDWETNNNNSSSDTANQEWNNNNNNSSDQTWNTNNNDSSNTTDQGWDTNNNDSSDTNDEGWDTVSNTNNDNKSSKANQNGSKEQKTNANTQNVPQSTSNASGKIAWYGPYGPYQAAKFYRDMDVPAIAEEEPRYDVPQAVAQAKGVTKQVQPGRGYIYNKKSLHPAKYLDTLQDPYARFIFKYRPKEQIKTETGIDVSLDPTPDTDRNALEGKSRDELIELVLRAKGALGGDIPDQPPPKPVVAPAVPAPFEHVPIAPPQNLFPTYYLPAFRRPSVQASSSGAKPSSTTNTAAAAADQSWGSGNASSATEQQNDTNNNSWQQGGEASGWNNQQASGTGCWDGPNEEEPAAADRSYPPHNSAPSNPNIPALSAVSPLNLPGPSYPTSGPNQQDRACPTPDRPSAADPPPSPLYQSSSGSPAIVRSVPLEDPFGPGEVAEPRTEPLPEHMTALGMDDPIPAGFSSWDRYFMHPNSPDIPDEYVYVPIVDAPDRPPDPPPMSRQPAPGEPHDFWL